MPHLHPSLAGLQPQHGARKSESEEVEHASTGIIYEVEPMREQQIKKYLIRMLMRPDLSIVLVSKDM